MNAEELVLLLERGVRGFGSEHYVQIAIERCLLKNKIAYEREVQLSKRDRVDFLVDRVAIEVKVRGGITAVICQLERYSLSERIASLILLTTKSTLARVPHEMNNKPVLAAVILPGI